MHSNGWKLFGLMVWWMAVPLQAATSSRPRELFPPATTRIGLLGVPASGLGRESFAPEPRFFFASDKKDKPGGLRWWESKHSWLNARAVHNGGYLEFDCSDADIDKLVSEYQTNTPAETVLKLLHLMAANRKVFAGVDGKVCRHHAWLLYRARKKLGLEIEYRVYTWGSGNDDGHSWNRVKLNGILFVVDAMNGETYTDDPEAQKQIDIELNPHDPVHEPVVHRIYDRLLKRPADTSGLAYYCRRLSSGWGRERVAKEVATSNEYRETRIRSFYRSILRREPEGAPTGGQDPVMAAVGQVNAGHFSLEDVRINMFRSPEYFDKISSGDYRSMVKGLYMDCLGRNPSEQEVAVQAANLRRDRDAVANFIARSPEAAKHLAKNLYLDILKRPANVAEYEGWGKIIFDGRPMEDVIAGFISAKEFGDLTK